MRCPCSHTASFQPGYAGRCKNRKHKAFAFIPRRAVAVFKTQLPCVHGLSRPAVISHMDCPFHEENGLRAACLCYPSHDCANCAHPMPQAKSPNEILAEFETMYINVTSELEQLTMPRPADWLRSSMSSLLRWAAEQMPDPRKSKFNPPTPVSVYYLGRTDATDDCKATLLNKANELL